eukprot:3497441-Pyramimonas_sp.AAC.1
MTICLTSAPWRMTSHDLREVRRSRGGFFGPILAAALVIEHAQVGLPAAQARVHGHLRGRGGARQRGADGARAGAPSCKLACGPWRTRAPVGLPRLHRPRNSQEAERRHCEAHRAERARCESKAAR